MGTKVTGPSAACIASRRIRVFRAAPLPSSTRWVGATSAITSPATASRSAASVRVG